ncbi:MAG TPA: hypothetical protein VFR87_11020 [Nocardioidaceae bacterium]|nr:hypothetical protein [Nocardioidaceae bacterium]
MRTQPVASAEVVLLSFELATGPEQGNIEFAGPRQEKLVALVRRLVALRGDEVEVEVVPAPASVAGGSVLPGPDALLRGTDWGGRGLRACQFVTMHGRYDSPTSDRVWPLEAMTGVRMSSRSGVGSSWPSS